MKTSLKTILSKNVVRWALAAWLLWLLVAILAYWWTVGQFAAFGFEFEQFVAMPRPQGDVLFAVGFGVMWGACFAALGCASMLFMLLRSIFDFLRVIYRLLWFPSEVAA